MRVIQWQYLVRKLTSVYTGDELTKKLNAFGNDGYELVSISKVSENGDSYIIFKRPIGYVNIEV